VDDAWTEDPLHLMMGAVFKNDSEEGGFSNPFGTQNYVCWVENRQSIPNEAKHPEEGILAAER